jgi:hypothetical protein
VNEPSIGDLSAALGSLARRICVTSPLTEWMSMPQFASAMPRESWMATIRSATSVVSRITGLCLNISPLA